MASLTVQKLGLGLLSVKDAIMQLAEELTNDYPMSCVPQAFVNGNVCFAFILSLFAHFATWRKTARNEVLLAMQRGALPIAARCVGQRPTLR